MNIIQRSTALLAMASLGIVCAQAQVGNPQPASTAMPLAVSGRQQAGTVSAQQAAQPGAVPSVDVVSPSLQVQGAYAGSAGSSPQSGAVSLSLADAVHRGLQFNLGQVGASNALRQARAQRAQQLAALLPSVGASLSESAAKVDLQAEGFSASNFGAAGFAFPTTVGPFHYYAAQVNAASNLFDLTALHNLRAATANAQSSSLSAQDARQAVVLAVSGMYMQVLAAESLVAYQQDEVRFAEASYRQAATQLEAGTKAEIDTNRSLVELHSEQERLASEQAAVAKQKMQLARLIGISPAADLTLTSKMSADTHLSVTLEAALQQAFASRQDLKAAEAQVRAAEEAHRAALSEHLPTASVQGSYGLEGVDPNHGTSVFSASAGVNLPLFNGGRMKADAELADAALSQRRAEFQDARGAVELDVRNAFIDLQVASGQVQLATENRKLALETLRQSQDRFTAGAATSVEVVQSQQALGAANRDYVNALFAENVARIAMARATGHAEQSVASLLDGK